LKCVLSKWEALGGVVEQRCDLPYNKWGNRLVEKGIKK
jgi:hypothetical protein